MWPRWVGTWAIATVRFYSGQHTPWFDSCQLTITWMSIIKLNTVYRVSYIVLARKCDISHWLPCGADGRTEGHTVTWLPKFLECVDKQFFMVLHCARTRAPLKNNDYYCKVTKTIAFATLVKQKCPSHLKEYRKKASHVSDFGQWIFKTYQVNFQILEVTFDQVSSLLLDWTNFPWLTTRVRFKSTRPDVTTF